VLWFAVVGVLVIALAVNVAVLLAWLRRQRSRLG